MEVNTLRQEFEILIEIAQDILYQNQELDIDQFLQLCLDIRKNERIPIDIKGKNLVVLPDGYAH